MNLRPLLLPALLLAACSSNEPASRAAPAASDQLSMTRGPCFGACPMYTVTAWGDGRVRFVGERFVEKTGEHTTTIEPVRVAELFAYADSIGFFDMPQQVTPANESSCGQYHTDAPSAEITMIHGARDRTVSHYHGCDREPPGLTDFEERIDAVLGTRAWIGSR